jgi:hypothetical protein
VGGGNYLLEISNMLDFEGNEKLVILVIEFL